MKRIVASLGVAALGAACVQDSNAQGSSGDALSASLALRGFYDNNINTSPSGKVGSFGAEISPTLGFELPLDQTTLSLVYTYCFRYYEKQPGAGLGHDDQTHTIAARLMHSFNERTTISAGDSFVIGQEPDVLRTGDFTSTAQRISGQNIRNYGNVTLNHQFSPKLGVEAGYGNSLFDYEDHNPPNTWNGRMSNSGLLDRMEHNIHLDGRWTLQPNTVALVGYAFDLMNYTGGEIIGFDSAFTPLHSNIRDSRSHYAYAGLEHTFRPDLTGSLRVGARFSDYFNSPANETGTSPYVSASLNYTYSQGSSLKLGVSHDMSATDQFSTQGPGGSITTDSEATSVYGSITHRILPDLFGTLMGQFQNSTFNGGQFDGVSEQYYIVSATLEYHVNRHLSTSVSYHYDRLESDLPVRSFDRNRVYLGATLTY